MATVGIKDMYWFYKKGRKEGISRTNYTSIVEDFTKFMMDKVWEGHVIKIPERLGTLEIKGRALKIALDENGEIVGAAPNWKETYKLWKSNPEAAKNKEKIYCLNEHTQKNIYKFFWSKKKIYLKFKDIYNLVMSRANKRKLAELIKSGKEYYVSI